MAEHDQTTVAALDALERRLPSIQLAHADEADFRRLVSSEADRIEAKAPDVDRLYVRGRIDCMLKNVGAIPGEEEGEPCE